MGWQAPEPEGEEGDAGDESAEKPPAESEGGELRGAKSVVHYLVILFVQERLAQSLAPRFIILRPNCVDHDREQSPSPSPSPSPRSSRVAF